MGLDIVAYRQLNKLDVLFKENGAPVRRDGTPVPFNDYFKVYVEPYFKDRCLDLEHGAIYGFVEKKEVYSRSATNYNIWREALAKLAGYPQVDIKSRRGDVELSHAAAAWKGVVTEGPFVELVNFADNEGTIGPAVSAKLLRDIIEWDARAKSVDVDLENFHRDYSNIQRGLEMAADGGALSFR